MRSLYPKFVIYGFVIARVYCIRKIERIQRAATKMVPTLRDLSYEERLERLKLLMLEKRREKGDLITIYSRLLFIPSQRDQRVVG